MAGIAIAAVAVVMDVTMVVVVAVVTAGITVVVMVVCEQDQVCHDETTQLLALLAPVAVAALGVVTARTARTAMLATSLTRRPQHLAEHQRLDKHPHQGHSTILKMEVGRNGRCMRRTWI